MASSGVSGQSIPLREEGVELRRCQSSASNHSRTRRSMSTSDSSGWRARSAARFRRTAARIISSAWRAFSSGAARRACSMSSRRRGSTSTVYTRSTRGQARQSARGCHFHRHAGEPPSRAGLEVRFVPGQVHHLVQRYPRLPGLDRTSARSLISAGRTRACSRSEIRGHDTQLSVPTCPAPARAGLAAPDAASERSRATPMPSRSMPQQTWSASDRC